MRASLLSTCSFYNFILVPADHLLCGKFDDSLEIKINVSTPEISAGPTRMRETSFGMILVTRTTRRMNNEDSEAHERFERSLGLKKMSR